MVSQQAWECTEDCSHMKFPMYWGKSFTFYLICSSLQTGGVPKALNYTIKIAASNDKLFKFQWTKEHVGKIYAWDQASKISRNSYDTWTTNQYMLDKEEMVNTNARSTHSFLVANKSLQTQVYPVSARSCIWIASTTSLAHLECIKGFDFFFFIRPWNGYIQSVDPRTAFGNANSPFMQGYAPRSFSYALPVGNWYTECDYCVTAHHRVKFDFDK